jgi:predicted dehydrogenase
MSEKQRIRWGILGCGRIAGKFAEDLALVPDAELTALGSSDLGKAQAFARRFPARHLHGSYRELAANPEVDVIYVATPHAMHHENTLLCLRHRKAVLCEKAFAINHRQASEMVATAREEKVFLMEALWTKFLPHYRTTMEMIASGRLGKVRSVLANFGFQPTDPVPDRLYNPALGGGTMLDIGIYNVFLAQSVLGVPDGISASMTPSHTGVDAQCAVTFHYRDGAIAHLFSTFLSNLATDADISGDAGRIRLTTRFYEPSATVEYYKGTVDTRAVVPVEKRKGWGYLYEIEHVHECLRQGLTESPVMTHLDSLQLMQTLDRIRMAAGITYPADGL